MRSGLRVAIAGAGPAGLACAWLLARNGVDVTVVERQRDFERTFRGEALMPTGLDALFQMGLGDELNGLPWRHLESWDIHLDGREIMHVVEPSAELGDRALRVVAQPKLLELLLAKAESTGSFRLVAPATVRGLLDSNGRVHGLRVSQPDGELEVEADLVLGCDGRGSVVRARAHRELELLPESYDILWFKLPVPPELAGRCPIQIFASGPEAALAYVSWDERWQLAWLMDKGGWNAVRERDWLAECASLMPESLERHVLDHRDALEGPVPLDVIVGRCRDWTAPGVLLLGDAAHPMSPIRAQGINMALRDAIVAANHLTDAAHGKLSVDEATAAVQREREPEIARAQKLQYRESRGQRWARERPWLIWPMLTIAPLLARTKLIQSTWLRQQHPLRFGVTEVTLRV